MADPEEKSFCVLEYHTSKSVVTVKRAFRANSKNRILVPTLPNDLADLKARVIAAVKNSDCSILTRVWKELEYRISMCRVTSGEHIEYV